MLLINFEKLVAKFRLLINNNKIILSRVTYSSISSTKDEKASELECQKRHKKEKLVNIYENYPQFFENNFNQLIKKSFFTNSSEIYGGLKGAYDYGPSGCNLKNNIINVWRDSFVCDENFLEIDSSILTSNRVLQASGHLRCFNDLFVQDQKSGNLYRCDHLISKRLRDLRCKKSLSDTEKEKIDDILNKLNTMKEIELQNIIKEYKITGPENGPLSKTGTFNLLFSIMKSSEKNDPIFLRPETAQGIFVNFQSLLKFNHNKLPFGVAQLGTSFRNEINPEHKLIRAREFQMAEIEYFYNPKFTNHDRFDEVADLEMNIWLESDQEQGSESKRMFLKTLVYEKNISENHAYFLGRIYQFLIKVGIDPGKLRFRQHLKNEKAHYSSECWDAECQTSLGWIECVGCSNRGSYDLVKHSEESGISLHAIQYPDISSSKSGIVCFSVTEEISKIYKDRKNNIINYFENLSQSELISTESQIINNGKVSIRIDNENFIITKEMITFGTYENNTKAEKVIPHVIEPSFGIGRILYCVLEHNFYCRQNNLQRIVLTFPNNVAPFKVSVLPLMSIPIFEPVVKTILDIFKKLKIRYLVDYSNESIGRRYSRADEIGTPFIITVDYNSINPNLNVVTIRERNSMEQIHVEISELQQVLYQLLFNDLQWNTAVKMYPSKVCN